MEEALAGATKAMASRVARRDQELKVCPEVPASAHGRSLPPIPSSSHITTLYRLQASSRRYICVTMVLFWSCCVGLSPWQATYARLVSVLVLKEESCGARFETRVLARCRRSPTVALAVPMVAIYVERTCLTSLPCTLNMTVVSVGPAHAYPLLTSCPPSKHEVVSGTTGKAFVL